MSVATTRIGFWNTVDRGRKWLVVFDAGKNQLVLFDWSNNTGAIDVKMDGSVLEENSSLSHSFFNSSNKYHSYIVSIAKIGALIGSVFFYM